MEEADGRTASSREKLRLGSFEFALLTRRARLCAQAVALNALGNANYLVGTPDALRIAADTHERHLRIATQPQDRCAPQLLSFIIVPWSRWVTFLGDSRALRVAARFLSHGTFSLPTLLLHCAGTRHCATWVSATRPLATTKPPPGTTATPSTRSVQTVRSPYGSPNRAAAGANAHSPNLCGHSLAAV